jgi:hypothetical protein
MIFTAHELENYRITELEDMLGEIGEEYFISKPVARLIRKPSELLSCCYDSMHYPLSIISARIHGSNK